MKNKIKEKDLEKVSKQLDLLEDKKNKITKKISKEYLLYLKIIRESLFSSVEKGIYGLSYSLSDNDTDINSNEITDFIKKNISLIINEVLPFITIEQLYLSDLSIPNDLIHEYEVNENEYFQENKGIQIDQENNFINEEPLQFEFNSISNTYKYYQSISNDEITSLDLDIIDLKTTNTEPDTLINNEKQFFISLLELVDETQTSKIDNYRNISNQTDDVFLPINISNILNWFELIDKSLNNLLKKLSYKINLELFKKQFIKKIISEDSFLCLASKSFLIKHPSPYVIEFDLNSKNLLIDKIKLPSISLINISNIELEFCNLNLAARKNNINDLKKELKLLIKKQIYWKKKKLNSKNSNHTLNKI